MVWRGVWRSLTHAGVQAREDLFFKNFELHQADEDVHQAEDGGMDPGGPRMGTGGPMPGVMPPMAFPMPMQVCSRSRDPHRAACMPRQRRSPTHGLTAPPFSPPAPPMWMGRSGTSW